MEIGNEVRLDERLDGRQHTRLTERHEDVHKRRRKAVDLRGAYELREQRDVLGMVDEDEQQLLVLVLDGEQVRVRPALNGAHHGHR